MTSGAGDPGARSDVPGRAERSGELHVQPERYAALAALVPGVACLFEIHAGGALFLPYASPGMAALYGEAGIGPGESPIYDFLHAADAAEVRGSLDSAARELGAWHAEFRLHHPSHGERWIDGRALPLREPDGRVVWQGYFEDVTGRKRAERRFAMQLAISNELVKARSLAEVARRVLAELCNAEQRARGVYWEVDAVAGVLRRRDAWPPGDRDSEPLERERDDGIAGRAWAGTTPIVSSAALAVPVVLGNRVLAVFEVSGGEPRSASDALTASLGAVSLQLSQFAERVRAEDALRESELQLLSVIENLSEGVVLCKLDGRILHWNPAALALYGLTPEDEWRHSFATLRERVAFETLDGAPVAEHDRPLIRVFRGEQLHDYEVRLRRTDRSFTRVLSYGCSLVAQPDGTQLAIMNVADITERVRATAELHDLNAELERRVVARTAELQAANRDLEAFSYSVSHDLRTPLRAVNGFAQILLEDFGSELPAEGRRLLGVVSTSAYRMGQLIDDLLTFSRLGRQPVNRSRIDMAALARSVAAELSPPYGRAHVRIAELPPCDGDPALVRQIWVNLLANALKYSRMRDPAEIEIGFEVGTTGPLYFVRDNGIGFAMSFAHMLFGVFQRLHGQHEFEGTGVGLAIVHRIVDRHRGRVWALGAVDHGATFCFTLQA